MSMHACILDMGDRYAEAVSHVRVCFWMVPEDCHAS